MELNKFLLRYGIDKTTNFEIYDIAKSLGIKIKVLMRNEIPEEFLTELDEVPFQSDEINLIKQEKNYILNLETTKEKGSHWVLYANYFDENTVSQNIYFDPYGIPPLNNLKVDLYNTLQIQPEGTSMCGQLCLYVLYKLETNGYEFFQDIILDLYDDISKLIV